MSFFIGRRLALVLLLCIGMLWTLPANTQAAAELPAAGPAPVVLGTAGGFVILAKSAVSNTGNTSVVGNIGLSPAARSFITGFSDTLDPSNRFATSSLVIGSLYASDMADPTPSNLTTAIGDMETAYADAAGRLIPDHTELGDGNIDGMTLAPGLYKWGTGVTIPIGVTLSGNADDVWIFQIAQDLTVGNGAIVALSGGAQAKNIFWQVAGQVTLGTTSIFKGVILCQTAIVLETGSSLNGRALAQTAVTVDATTVIALDINYTLALTATEGGSVTKTLDQMQYTDGTKVLITAIPAEGYIFTGWVGDIPLGSETSTTATITMDSDKTIEATFKRPIALTLLANGPGTATVAPDAPYFSGSTVTLTATPDEGCHFTGWTGDILAGSENVNPVTITVTADMSITANFETDESSMFTLITVVREGGVVTREGGIITVSPDLEAYGYGSSVVITAVPRVGYAFAGWGGDISEEQRLLNPTTVTMTTDKTITANFETTANYLVIFKSCNLKVVDAPNGRMDFHFTDASPRSTVKIKKLRKLPKKIANTPTKQYVFDLSVVGDLLIEGGGCRSFYSDAPIERFTVDGPISAISSKAVIQDIFAPSIRKVSMRAERNSDLGGYASTVIATTAFSRSKMSVNLKGVILEFLDVYQDVDIKVYSLKWKDSQTRINSVSRGGVGRITNDMKASPLEFNIVANRILKLSARGASVAPDFILSESDVRKFEAKSAVLNRLRYPASFGFADADFPMQVYVNSDIGTIFGTDGVAGFFFAGVDLDTNTPNYSGSIKAIETKNILGSLVGEAHVSPLGNAIKFEPEQGNLFTVFTQPLIVEGDVALALSKTGSTVRTAKRTLQPRIPFEGRTLTAGETVRAALFAK